MNTHLIATLSKNTQEEVRVALDEYRGTHVVDLRVFAEFTAAKVPMPTKKGVSLRIDLLPELVRTLQAAEAKARELGLIGGVS